ncbi:MAG: SIMPL domain-containing protein [Cyclobacteriaceae bacterium]
MNTKRILILNLFLVVWMTACHGPAVAQDSESATGGLQVSGTGEMNVLPDLMETHIHVNSEAREFQTAVTNLRQQTDQIVAHLTKNGYKQDDIVTMRMSVNKQYDYRNGQRLDKGYMATQTIKLTSDYTAENMGSVVDMMGKSPVDAPFSFGFTLKDESREKYREELIGMAVEDARSKAGVLAKAAGVSLKSIRNISYGHSGGRPPVIMRDMMMKEEALQADAAAVNLEVDEMTLMESVNIVWSIKE